MWTNVFKLFGLHQISWFQFLPLESDLNPLPDRSVRSETKDSATFLVLSSHLQLQKKGFLSTWTNSFVGPWDPSQGLHNPDEKIKLWLFLPGRHLSVVETAQAAVSGLRVVASGLWLAPGDSEEVAAALSQALRNCIERSLSGLSYMRYGDVFSKYNPFQSEGIFRRGQPTVEFVFAATEEAIFVHAIVSAKHIRALSSDDLERALRHASRNSSHRHPVIVSPNGMRGRLIGGCPSDLVKEVYLGSGKSKASSGLVGLPSHVPQGFGCQLRGQTCYAEVTVGCPIPETDKALAQGSNTLRSECLPAGRCDQKVSQDHSSTYEKTFLYPSEAVLVPVLNASLTRSSLRRFWLQNWLGPSLMGSSYFMHCGPQMDTLEDSNGLRTQKSHYSSSNSNSSSLSSVSSSSSESDYNMTSAAGDLEADADSLISSADLQNDRLKMGAKRSRSVITEMYGQVDAAVPMQEAYKSDFGSSEVNTSAITRVANEQIGSHWDWDDDDRGVDMDIQALLSEFGDFGDFFETDALPFGEPPGTAESQTLMFSGSDLVVSSSPVGMMDVSEHMLLPVGFPSLEGFNPPAVSEEHVSKSQEITLPSGPIVDTPASNIGEFDHIIKAEALMTFAQEYGAVEAPTSDFSSSIFKNPYLPKSCNVESANSSTNNYKYGATPPSSPCLDGSDEKNGVSLTSKTCQGNDARLKNYYTHVEAGKVKDGMLSKCNDSSAISMEATPSSVSFSNVGPANAVKPVQKKVIEGTAEHLVLSMKTVLATEVECLAFQASMCKIRHTLLSSSAQAPVTSSRLSGSAIINHLPGEQSSMTDNISSMFEVKKKESIPVRIAGDVDGGLLDGHLNAPIRVWRPVGVPKVPKPTSSPGIEVCPSPLNSFSEEGGLSYGQRQPLQELLDGMQFLVQQATSFVDVTLDADCGDGPYGWLALEEQWRRGFSCGPSMVHAGCGGTLASCHSLDIAGLELVDPLSADVQVASVISLLQSDIKSALKAAFGNLDGPLSVTEWCKGRNQLGDVGNMADGFSAESSVGECRDPSSTTTFSGGEISSPSQSTAVGSSNIRVTSGLDGSKLDESCQRRLNQDNNSESGQQFSSRLRPTFYVLPLPAILVGYQDDWLKTSAGSLQLWEKAPFEPYALPKPVSYYVLCPNIDPLTSAAADFFQQLGTVYETCKLGTHLPQTVGNQMEIDSGKASTSGFVLLDCPQSMKMVSSNASLVGSMSDFFLSLSNGWDLTSYLKSLSKALKGLKYAPCSTANPKEGNSGSCLVIYVVCPFPEPNAVLKTVIESSVAMGSVILPLDRRVTLNNQVGKAMSCSAAVDEASTTNILVLSGFSISKIVLHIVTVDAVFRVTSPTLSELTILKETAFTVYNKARRISRGSCDVQSSSLSGRSQLVMTQMTSPISSMWKECVGPRISGPSLTRDGEMDASLRTAAWDNSWQTRTGGLSGDTSRAGDFLSQEEARCMFEPLFILAEPGSLEHGVSPTFSASLVNESSKGQSDDSGGGFMQSANSVGSADSASSSQVDGSESDSYGSGHKKLPTIHCCYGWTEDWRWLVCIWTDARGELLDSHIFPFGGISSRQDTKGLQCLFAQVLHQGCQILQICSDNAAVKPRDFVITRIGSFYELEYLEWQKAIYSVGGAEMKSWTLQLRRSMTEGMSVGANGASLQQQEMNLIQERNLPSSPSPLYSPHSKSSGYMKGGLGPSTARKQVMGGHAGVESPRGLLQWVQTISFVTVSVDHSLNLVFPADVPSPGGAQSGSAMGPSSYLEGFTPVKSLGSTSASFLLIPSPSMRFLPPTPLQLPTCLTAESPPLAHLLHSKGAALPLSTAFVASKAVPTMRKDFRGNLKEEWPSVLSVGLIDYYGGNNVNQDKVSRSITKQGGRTLNSEGKDLEVEMHLVLESVVAELQALSWMTVSPAYIERRTALPFHCDMVLRLRRLLHFAEKELSRQPEKL
ncbi:mediator of RNA polymerase II transcription subunit 13 isoform X2 [Rhodamnia argentea]|uniref:Mediator of RNA polymerase II transcription subunit 13 n=1 Tax=Rhodamnia argentea TaxID=178133 RepID=A0A8B8NPP3_9MYRT|nr:mediator of RNA polymerase II transcription subunit 13 isoform X2 [Rhodamnia argentea]